MSGSLTELLEARRVTPEEVEQASFSRVRFGGVSDGEVAAFLDRVHDELVVLAAERDAALAGAARDRDTAAATAREPGPGATEGGRILAEAPATAARLVAAGRA